MYLNFYNMKREPFNITPDPQFFYLSPSHREALAAVICGVNRRKGFVAITGEVGVGKTTVLRSVLERIDRQNVKVIFVFNSNITFSSLLKTIFKNLGETPRSEEMAEMVDQLHLILIEEYRAGRNLVLIIDEAQNMPLETLEDLRMLSNLETSSEKLIQIVLSGQTEFEQILNRHALRQLNQRIAIRVKILPLSAKESLEYIDHRLNRSLISDTHPFTSRAMSRIVKQAGGIPRIINILCDNCLVTAFGRQQKRVTSGIAREIIAEQSGKGRTGRMAVVFGSIAILAVFSVFWVVTKEGGHLSLPVPNVSSNRPATPVAGGTLAPTIQSAKAVSSVVPKDSVVEQPLATRDDSTASMKEPDKNTRSIVRVPKRGDTLAKLVLETYGTVDSRLLRQVKKNNPIITNVDLIQEGRKIYFPVPDK